MKNKVTIDSMIATRNRLLEDLNWQRRVRVCGDSLSSERASTEMFRITAELMAVNTAISEYGKVRIPLRKKIKIVAAWAGAIVAVSAVLYGLWH